MDRIPVSTVLLTKNSAASLRTYFASMDEIDDIILLDGGSTDDTLKLAAEHSNCRVFPQDPRFLDDQGYIIDFSGMRNSGYALAKYKWILCVDADEEANPELLKEVREIVAKNEPAVFFARRIFFWKGKPVVNFAKSSSDQIRMFHLDCVRGCVKPVHERVDIIEGSPLRKLSTVVNVPLPEAKKVRAKYDRYAKIEAKARKGTTFVHWFRWLFIRNIISVSSMIILNLASYLIPRCGPRFPFSLVLEQARYSRKITWLTCPLLR